MKTNNNKSTTETDEICKNCGHNNLRHDTQKEEKVCLKCYAVHDWKGNLLK